MSGQYDRGPIIEHEGLTHSWTLPPRPAMASFQAPKPERGWGVRASTILAALAGVGVISAGVAVMLLTTSEVSWAQGTSWRAVKAGDAAGLRDAVVAGSEAGLPLYPCRAAYAGATLLGRYRADFAGCHIGYDGKEVEAVPFEVLGPSWTDLSEGMRALTVGEITDATDSRPFTLRPVAVCRATYQGATHPGSWIGPDKTCSFGFGGRVVTSQNFTVLQAAPWMTWVSAPAAIPGTPLVEGAVRGGEEGGEPFFLCRAPTPRGVLAGKIKATAPGCSVPFDGRELVESRFELLMPRWVTNTSATAPVGALTAGREKTELQFPCRARNHNTLQPGRTTDQHPGCRVGMQSSEVVLPDYEVLAQ